MGALQEVIGRHPEHAAQQGLYEVDKHMGKVIGPTEQDLEQHWPKGTRRIERHIGNGPKAKISPATIRPIQKPYVLIRIGYWLHTTITKRSFPITRWSRYSRTLNAALWWITGGVAVALGLILYVPFLRDMFGFSPLHPDDLLLCLGAAIVSILWFEVIKLVDRRRTVP